MKRFTIAVIVLAAVPLAFAQGMKEMDMKNMPMKSGTTGTHKATGVVKSVDTKSNTVTLAHEPVSSLKWPAMTMAFKADDPKLVQGLTTGQKVSFEFTQRGKDYVLTSIK
jgi:Cu(I)/Ag(I) efflux system periplasmic protein CusF